MGKQWKQCESWIDAFELWCWRRLLGIPWTAVLNIHWKDWCWSWNSNPLSTWCEELTRWKRPWLWERLKVGGEGDNRGWDGWMASPSLWTWVWINSGSFWWTGKLGMLAIHEVAKSWTQPNEWIRLLYRPLCFITILSDDWHRMHTQTDSFLEKC